MLLLAGRGPATHPPVQTDKGLGTVVTDYNIVY